MRIVSIALSFIAMTGAVAAMMPPEAYEEARQTAPNVVVFGVDGVATPFGNLGTCVVSATVVEVERGTLYTIGQPIRIDVDCLREFNNDVPDGGVIWKYSRDLKASAYGRAYLDNTGAVLRSQYEILDEGDLPR